MLNTFFVVKTIFKNERLSIIKCYFPVGLLGGRPCFCSLILVLGKIFFQKIVDITNKRLAQTRCERSKKKTDVTKTTKKCLKILSEKKVAGI